MAKSNIFQSKYIFAFLVFFIGVFLLPCALQASEINEENIISLTNIERQKAGLDQLTVNQLLSKAAYEKAEAIFQNQNFAHNIGDKKFSAWIKDAGYDYIYAGENLAINFTGSEEVIAAWINSPLHKKNILNAEFEEIGVAVRQGSWNGENTTLVVQAFGTPIFTENKLYPIAYDQSFEEIYAPSNLRSEKFLTHSASRNLLTAEKSPVSQKIVLPASDSRSALNLFRQAEFNPEFLLLAVQIIQIFALGLMILLYFNLSRPHRYKL